MFHVLFTLNTDISVNSIDWLVFLMVTECVLCAVATEVKCIM